MSLNYQHHPNAENLEQFLIRFFLPGAKFIPVVIATPHSTGDHQMVQPVMVCSHYRPGILSAVIGVSQEGEKIS